MKIPPGLVGFDGKVLKGEVCLTSGNSGTPGNRTKLLEEGMKREGNHFTCYTLTAEDDAIVPYFSISSGEVEFADVVVDGILRASYSNAGARKTFSKKCEWFVGQVKLNNRIFDRTYQLQIAKRNTENTRNVKGGAPHSVGSIEIQIFRKDPNAHKKHATDSDSDDSSSASKEGSPDLGTAERAPTFENHIHWWNLNPCVDEDTIPSPPFEVGGVGYKKPQSNAKSLIVQKWPGDFKVWASFKFLLFSTANFHTLGFLDTPEYIGTPWNETSTTPKKLIVKDVSRASKSTSFIDPDVGSDHDDVVDTVENIDKPAPGIKTEIDEPAKSIKGKEVTRKTTQSSAFRETEVPSQVVKSMKPVGKQTVIIEDSESSETLDESHTKVNRTVSKLARPSKASQVIDLSGEDDSEATDNLVIAPTIKIEKDELTGNGIDQGNETHAHRKKKPLSMPGVEGAPASKAWNNRDRSLWYQTRGLSSNSDNLLNLNTDQPRAEGGLTLSDISKAISLDSLENLSRPSVSCVIGEASEKENVTHFKPLETQVGGSSWEPLTPPVSSKKPGIKHFNTFGAERRILFGDSNGTTQIESAARIILTEDNYSDNDSREASPSVKHDQRVPEDKAEELSPHNPEFTLETKTSNIEKPDQSSNVNNTEANLNEFIHTSAQPEDTEMFDAIEAGQLPAPRSPSPEAVPQSTVTGQDQDSVNKITSSQSQELNASQNGQGSSEKSTQEIPESILEGIAEAQRLQRAKRFPSSAIPEVETEESLAFHRSEDSSGTEMTNSGNNELCLEPKKFNSKLNDAPVGIGNQQDGPQDSPAEADESTITVATTKPAKQSNTRAPATAKPSSTPKTQPTLASKTATVQKPPAIAIEKSSNISTQPERSQAKSKKPTSKVESDSGASTQPEKPQAKPKKPAPKTTKTSSVPKTAKTPAPAVPEEPAPKPKGKGRAKAGANDKRKADQMTSASNSSGPNKTNISPALKQTSNVEGAIAVAEARKQAAIEKKQALEEKLEAIQVAKANKAEKEEADRINKEAQAFEDEVAELEKRIAMEQMDDE